MRGGENISPLEIEAVLTSHPLVTDAVAFGVPSALYGEEVGAAVVLSGEFDEAALRAWCGESLAAFKVPRRLYEVDAIPRTPTGKLQRTRIGSELIGRGT
jgi:long-chain acyl-CoA synthetase